MCVEIIRRGEKPLLTSESKFYSDESTKLLKA